MLNRVTLLLGRVTQPTLVAVTLLVTIALAFLLFLLILKLARRSGFSRTHVTYVLVFVFGLTLLFASGYAVTSTRWFCSQCHGPILQVEATSNLVHKSVSCYSCHRTSGLTGLATEKLKEVRMVGAQLRGKESGWSTPIGNTVCLRCHEKITKGVAVAGKIKVSHEEILQEGYSCQECHTASGHSPKELDPSLAMERCSFCHDGRSARQDCSLCHTNNVLAKNKTVPLKEPTHPIRGEAKHGVGNIYTCKGCHAEAVCSKCHLAMPHPDNWTYRHGNEAIKQPKACSTCHIAEVMCRDCHRIEMPHPSTWLSEHARNSQKIGEYVCERCHVLQSCDYCHAKHVHPSLKGGSSDAR